MINRCVAAGVLLAYVVVIAQSSAIGLGDTTNHLAREYIMADLLFHHGAHFGAQFRYHFLAVPYILPDLLLTAAVEVLGAKVAVASWTVLAFLSIPAALLLYCHVSFGRKGKELLEDPGTLFLLLCAAYLSTDYFFVVGFLAFQLGLACVIVNLSLIELLRRRWSYRLFALYCVLVAAAYLVHLSTLLFLAAIVGVTAAVRLWFRTSSVREELLLFSPILLMLAWYLGVAEHYHRPTDLEGAAYRWGTLRGKVLWTTRNFDRYGGHVDRLIELLYAASLLMLIRGRAWRDAFTAPRVVESLALVIAFFAMYLALPFSYGDGTYIDIRALAPAMLFVLLACLQLPRVEPPSRNGWRASSIAVVLALALSVLNLAYLERHFTELSIWSRKYLALVAAIPRGAYVLTVETVPTIWPYMAPAASIAIDRQALFPYLFSANTGAPQIYFRYVDRPYAPPDDWYMTHPSLPVDWRQIACTYQYILVTRPFDPRRIGVETNSVAETASAALLAIDSRACRERKAG